MHDAWHADERYGYQATHKATWPIDLNKSVLTSCQVLLKTDKSVMASGQLKLALSIRAAAAATNIQHSSRKHAKTPSPACGVIT
jgi:hypothetical protein